MDVKALREKFLKEIQEREKAYFSKKDLYLSQMERAKEDLEKVRNLLGERLEEWVKTHVPSLSVRDKVALARKYLEGDYKGEELPLGEKDVERIKALARLILEIDSLIREYEEAIEEVAKEVAPNATALVGGKLVAKFIAHAGSLEKLAKLPASTIQVLGAEKSLFKHLRSKGKVPSPKHGIILLSKYVRSLPKKLRGKMARRLAAKLAIAFRADVAGDDVAAKLKEDVEKRYKELEEMAKELKAQPKKGRGRRSRRRRGRR